MASQKTGRAKDGPRLRPLQDAFRELKVGLADYMSTIERVVRRTMHLGIFLTQVLKYLDTGATHDL
jgi:hypothetical protein